jgi:hypothetical protein
MSILSKHPCNTFNGWLYVERREATEAHTQQLRFRDEELEVNPSASGEPAAFHEWSLAQVRRLAGEERIARQIRNRQSELRQDLARLQLEEQRRVQHWADERDRIATELDLLADLLNSSAVPQ